MPPFLLAFLFGCISLLYATVGQAGGTAFLALMAFAAFPPHELRPTALALNIVAATSSTLIFKKGHLVDWTKLSLLLSSSVPMTFVGALIVLNESIYSAITGLVLILAAAILIFRQPRDGIQSARLPMWGSITIGAAVGFVSGLTGVGGGVFLAPILITLRWASPRETSALSAPFILANSIVGLIGALIVGQTPSVYTFSYGAAALAGAIIGTAIGVRWLSQNLTRYALATLLATAGLQLVLL
ncbi:MAG: sulfite exporter TauE/SafE family protein [Bradyrhizobium sp.]